MCNIHAILHTEVHFYIYTKHFVKMFTNETNNVRLRTDRAVYEGRSSLKSIRLKGERKKIDIRFSIRF